MVKHKELIPETQALCLLWEKVGERGLGCREEIDNTRCPYSSRLIGCVNYSSSI